MAVLFDTSVGVLLFRRKPPEAAREVLRVARTEIAGGSALLPAVALSELMIGETRPDRARLLAEQLVRLPVVVMPVEVAGWAGSMGAFLSAEGAPVPFPDLLVAATAVWLDVPLLAWDTDFARACGVSERSDSAHPGAAHWRALRLHPATLGA